MKDEVALAEIRLLRKALEDLVFAHRCYPSAAKCEADSSMRQARALLENVVRRKHRPVTQSSPRTSA